MKKVLFFVSLFVTASLYAGKVTVSRDVSSLASEYGWQSDTCYLNFQLDENISIISAKGNAKYLKETTKHSLRYYQGSSKGQFTICAKSGVVIQSVKFTYGSLYTGVITTNYGSDGKSIAEADQRLSGTAYQVEANSLTFYTGTTSTNTDGQVRITGFEVKYFIPTITKSAKDLGYGLGLVSNLMDGYQDIQVNNVISLHADTKGTLKYYSDKNSTTINCYRWTGPIEIKAREGVTINAVKISYNGGPRAVLTQNWGKDGKAIPAADRIASDSMLYVNANSLKLYVGDTTLLGTKSSTSPTLGITKIYVSYTDSIAIIEDFSNCKELKSDNTVDVAGINGIYHWQLTGFSRESSHHLYDDQTTQIYKGGKVVANNDEGGMKEVAFEWFASNKDKNAKFVVKAGTETLASIDSAATGGYYPVTFTQKDIKSNGALAIEVDAASGSQVEIHSVSIIPYLRFAMREDSVDTASIRSYDVKDILIDNTDDAANIVYSIESDETGGAAISGSVVDLNGSLTSGAVVVKAAWESVTAHFTLNVKVPSTPTGIDNANDNLNHNRKQIVNGQLRIIRNGEVYSVLGQTITK